MAWVVPVLAMFATMIALSRRSAREAERVPVTVDDQRLLDGHGVIVLREHVVRLVIRWSELVVDTVHGETRRVTLPPGTNDERLLKSIRARWPELVLFDAHTLVRRVERKRSSRPPHRTPPRAPFTLSRPHDGDGYREAAASLWVLDYAGERPWSITVTPDGWTLEREGTPAVTLAGPILLVHTRDFALRIVTGSRDEVLPCDMERDVREALRLTRQLLDETS